MAMRAAESCYKGYRNANPETRKLFNQALLDELRIKDRKIVAVTYAEPFPTYLDPSKISVSNKEFLVALIGRLSNHPTGTMISRLWSGVHGNRTP